MRFFVLAALMAALVSTPRVLSAQPRTTSVIEVRQPLEMCPDLSQDTFCQLMRQLAAATPASRVVGTPPPAAQPPPVTAPVVHRQPEQTVDQCIALCDATNQFCQCACRHLLWNDDDVCRNTQDTIARLILQQRQQAEATSNLRSAVNPLLREMRRDIVPDPLPVVQPDLSRPRARRRRHR